MHIEHTEEGDNGRFFVRQDGKDLAELVYSLSAEGKMVIQHTEVDDLLGGKNVGRQLVSAAVEHARASNMKIIPLCSFAKRIIGITPEMRDVLD